MPKKERFRPLFHFSPKKNWINDPNGLIYLDGSYHMYYQYNPKGDQWGNICWGHAMSKDLIHWEELPVAIPSDESLIFSGTTVLADSGAQVIPEAEAKLIAAYTSCEYIDKEDGSIEVLKQHQSLAFSDDGGMQFEQYAGNPVLDIGSAEFRDPKIFWHERSKSWIMLVSKALERKIAIYRSEDLKDWKHASEFGPAGDASEVWECPDLFQLKTADGSHSKWVLSLSGAGHAPGTLGMQYFLGSFDGFYFTAENPDSTRYLDYGTDFYAGISFQHMPDDEVVMIAWTNSHHYAADTHALTLRRNVYL